MRIFTRRPNSYDRVDKIKESFDDMDMDSAVVKGMLCVPFLVKDFFRFLYYRITNLFMKDVIIIDDHDIWSLDYTLARIIVPSLQTLKKNQHGSCNVDDKDLPKELSATANNMNSQDIVHYQWEYILDVMIFAFTFIRDEREYSWVSGEKTGILIPDLVSLRKDYPDIGTLSHLARDHGEGKKKEYSTNVRLDDSEVDSYVTEGLRLFGKYYRGLWD